MHFTVSILVYTEYIQYTRYILYNKVKSSQLYISLFTFILRNLKVFYEDIEESEIKPTRNSILSITHARSNIIVTLYKFEACTNLKISRSKNQLKI